MFALFFTGLHVALYSIWKYVRDLEDKTRPDGHLIPWYATGGVGNAYGFSLVVLSFGLAHPTPSAYQIATSVALGLLISWVLHGIWKRGATQKTVSLYLRTGHTTPAGKLHLVYVVFVSSLITLSLFSWAEFSVGHKALFVSGGTLYAIAVVVDRWRGVL